MSKQFMEDAQGRQVPIDLVKDIDILRELYLINFSGQPATVMICACYVTILYLINFSGQPATFA